MTTATTFKSVDDEDTHHDFPPASNAKTRDKSLGGAPHKLTAIIILSLLVAILTFSSANTSLSSFAPSVLGGATADAQERLASPSSALLDMADPRNILKRLIQEKYPECQLNTTTTKTISLSQMGSYVPAVDRTPLYNHMCFIMKARYNCAYRPDAPFRMAYHYELVLQLHPNDNTTTSNNNTMNKESCRIKALIRDTLQEWNTAEWKMRSTPTTRQQHVMIQGNSFARQLWEALVCGIVSSSYTSHLVTDFGVQQGGPGISIEDFTIRNNRPVGMDELGTRLTNQSVLDQTGCHGESKSDISAYYRRSAATPPNLPGCNDNVATIELGRQWRFSYIFKPTMYTPEALEYIYKDRLGAVSNSPTINEDVEWHVVWNSVLREPQNITPPLLFSVPHRKLDIESWLWTLRKLQLRDLNWYFGANNPWISKPPDYHACMPGIPDDQVHLLLYLLWTDYSFEK